VRDVDGLNRGYAQALLGEYLANPDAVPPAWRALFESGETSLLEGHPGLLRLLERLPRNGAAGNGHEPAPEPEAAPPAEEAVAPVAVLEAPAPAEADPLLLGAIAAAQFFFLERRVHYQ